MSRCNARFDLLILDLTMPGASGVDLIERIRARDTDLPILIYSMHNELLNIKPVLQTGVLGFVTKGSAPDILRTAIRKVATGGRFIDPAIAEQMVFEKPVQRECTPHERLSERELHVMKRLAQGWGAMKIAEELFISNKTVSTYKTRLMEKMGFQSTAEMIRYAASCGLID